MLRYSTFLPLYPIGVYGELALTFASFPFLAKADPATAPLIFEYLVFYAHTFCGFATLAETLKYLLTPMYAVGLPLLYSMMLGSRNRVMKKFKEQKAKKD
eukprot:TRINITY_DN8667_c0_g1_i3.p2 TRINITY_DN8667_c0_g1~~TRINITY_DN8667_c0_g1_i3.p2  ORF type:complete len:100 (-),score=28.66 TRINITY_DN8667_c0_g1_i3:64-363(-)